MIVSCHYILDVIVRPLKIFYLYSDVIRSFIISNEYKNETQEKKNINE